jgi:hypothetical protein
MSGTQSRPQCQVCLKIAHTASVCWYRYDEDYAPDNHVVAMASFSCTDPNWYLDSDIDPKIKINCSLVIPTFAPKRELHVRESIKS